MTGRGPAPADHTVPGIGDKRLGAALPGDYQPGK